MGYYVDHYCALRARDTIGIGEIDLALIYELIYTYRSRRKQKYIKQTFSSLLTVHHE